MIFHSICYMSDYQFFSILQAIENLNHVSIWDKVSAISMAATVIISLGLAGRGWYRNNRISWLTINQIYVNLVYGEEASPMVPSGLSLYVGIARRKDIPLEIYSAYVFLNSKGCDIRLGFKIRTQEIQSIIQGNVFFDLMRTVAINDESLHEKIDIEELYKRSLCSQNVSTIKRGEIDIHTNAGVYSKKLTRNEIKQFITIFSDIQQNMEKKND